MTTPRVKVLHLANRRYFVLRWKTRHGRWAEETTDIEIPPRSNQRAYRIARAKAERMAAEKEKSLLAAATDGALLELLDQFESHQNALGNSRRHVAQTIEQLKRTFDACGWASPGDIDGSSLAAYLDRLGREKGRAPRTLNAYLAAAKTFCGWLVAERVLAVNPIAYLRKRNEDVDRRRERRAFTLEELELVAAAAEAGGPFDGIPGAARAAAYWLAAYTGLREGEIANLTLRDFQLDLEQPIVEVPARRSKRRKLDRLPLHPFAAGKVKDYLATLDTISLSAPLFQMLYPGGGVRRVGDALKADMKAARDAWIAKATGAERARRKASDFLAYQDSKGWYADFHSLRHAFITLLAQAGVPFNQIVELARHSDFNLTRRVYTHLGLDDITRAVSALPTPAGEKTG